MNANCYKIIFSKRLGTLVAVGEHTSSTGKAASGQGCRGSVVADGFVGALRFTFASVALACLSLGNTQAQSSPIASTALPQGGSVSTGSATISTQGAAMAITQSTNKASINWQSFNVGTAASVNIAQPSASAVLLNRVVGNDPSQILGQLKANGQVILLNPNGVVFGKDGSVTASSFTASTFGLSDADFMAGYYKYNRNGSTAAVVNQGTIETSAGGFVALIGATVTNEGTIRAPQGDVVMAAAESVTLPEELVKPQPVTSANTVSVRMSKRVRLELDPAAINTAVNNTESGVVVTEGGQVLLQAAAISSAVASVTHSGRIDTSAPQAGAVTVLADNGDIKVNGSIKANSSGTDSQGQARKGGDIIIGRDIDTGVLARGTDVSGAALESGHGFVETSGNWLATYGTRVKAKNWLLDPTSITIANSVTAGDAYNDPNGTGGSYSYSPAATSVILNTDIQASLNDGTNVTIQTTGTNGDALGTGNINVNASISKTAGDDATLTLKAHNNIEVASNAAITSTSGKLHVVLNSDSDSSDNGAIKLNAGSSVITNGGSITFGGGANAAGYAVGEITTGNYVNGIFLDGATLSSAGGNITLKGKSSNSNWGFDWSSNGIAFRDTLGNVLVDSGSGKIIMDGLSQSLIPLSSNSNGVMIGGFSPGSNKTTIQSSYNGNDKAISITGIGNQTAGSTAGIWMGVQSSILASGSGGIYLDGTEQKSSRNDGSVSAGIVLAGKILSASGQIDVIGRSTKNRGIDLNWYGAKLGGLTGSSIGTSSANLVLTSNSIWLGDNSKTALNTTGTVTIKTLAATTSINLGAADVFDNVSTVLGLTQTELNTISASNLTIGSTNNSSITASAANTLTASTGNILLQSGGTVTINAALTTAGNLSIQTQGGLISTTAALSGRNISIDNTNGSIDASSGAIEQGPSSASATDAITIGSSITASNNLNMYGVSASRNGIKVSGALSAKNIQAIGQTESTTGTSGAPTTGFAWYSGNITTNGTSGDSLLKGISTNTNGGGFAAFNIAGNVTATAASGTSLTLYGDAITQSASGANDATRGFRTEVNTTLTTSGNVTIKGSSKSSDGINFVGNGVIVNGAGSTLTMDGTTSALGANSTGLSGVVTKTITLNNASSLSITGRATNTALTSATYSETAVNINGAITGSGGNISITGISTSGANSRGYSQSTGVDISSGGSNVNISAQNPSTSTNPSFITGGSIAAGNGDVIIQAAGGTVKQINGQLSGKNISIDTTNGVIDPTTGAITLGTATTSTANGTAITLASAGAKGISATGNVNIAGASTGSQNSVELNGVMTMNAGGTAIASSTGAIEATGNNSLINISGNRTVNNTAQINTGATGGTVNITSTLGGITGSGSIGTSTNKGATVTFNSATASTYSGAITETNFIKSGAGSLILNSWDVKPFSAQNPAQTANLQTKISASYTVNGGSLQLSTGGNYYSIAPVNVYINNRSTFSTGFGNGKWDNTTFNFDATGGGTLQFSGNAVGSLGAALSTTNTLITNGGDTNYVLNTFNSGTQIFTMNVADATSGDATSSGAFAGLVFKTPTGGTRGISNGGTVNKTGSGTVMFLDDLTFNTLNINAGTVQIGNGVNTSTGELIASTAPGTINIASGANLTIYKPDATTITANIAGSGNFNQRGAGTTTLTGTGTFTGATNISAGALNIGNSSTTGELGSGDINLSNNATLRYNRSVSTTIGNNISGAGNVSASITGASSNLSVDHAINLTNGTLTLEADGNLAVSQAISTANTTATAATLVAGKSTAAGTATGGNITFSGAGAISVGSGGRATLYTGSVAGSTGLGILAGFSRFNSSASSSGYTTALGSGTYAIYREAPTVTGTIANVSKTYDGQTYSGGYTAAYSGFANNDTSAQLSGISYGGAAITAVNAGNHTISGTASNGLGYTVSYINGTLTIDPKDITATYTAAHKTYDGSATASITNTTTGLITGDAASLAYTSASFADANAGTAKNVSIAGISLTGADAGNYNLLNTSASASANILKKELSISGAIAADKVADGSTTATLTHLGTLSGFVGNETVLLSNLTGTFDTATAGTNKAVALSATLANGANGGSADNYALENTIIRANIIAASGGGSNTKPAPIVPPKPMLPTQTTDASEGGGNGEGSGGSSGNPYLLMPANRPNSADLCTPNTLEDCLCETQEARPIDGLAICYQPKKTASSSTNKARRS